MTEINADIDILSSWALMARPDWDAEVLDRAVAGARNAGWGDAKIACLIVRLVFDECGTPWDLRNAAQEPQGMAGSVKASPEVMQAHLATMRQELAAAQSRRKASAA